jgi:hypothetical protein
MDPPNKISPVFRKETYVLALPLLMVFMANKFFYLGSWWSRPGIFNVQDIGNLIIWLSLVVLVTFSTRRDIFRNPLSIFIGIFMVQIVFTAYLATVYYGQPFFDGLIGTRHQFYYLIFFLFLAVFPDTEKIARFLDLLVILGVVLTVLGLINYWGPTIFSHRWAGGHGMRLGVVRAYIPGTDIIALGAIWSILKWTDLRGGKVLDRTLWVGLFLLGAIFFRQTRMMIISVVTAIGAILVLKHQWRPILLAASLVVLTSLGVGVTLKHNILLDSFSSAVTDVLEGEGTWPGRVNEWKVDYEEFKKHPVAGSGITAMRWATVRGGTRLQRSMESKRAVADLGYSSWMKAYGLVGIVWLLAFYITQVVLALKALRRSCGMDRTLAQFTLAYILFQAVSYFTLNHLMSPSGILLDVLNAAIIVRLYEKTRHRAVAEEGVRQRAGEPLLKEAPSLPAP